VKVTFPLRPDQLEPALTHGVGDLIAYGIAITPEREQQVAFFTPVQTDVTQIIVTGPNFGAVSSLADLGGKDGVRQRADLWSKVLDKVQPHPDLPIASPVQVGWVMRKSNPQLKQLADEFVASHAVETSFGNTLLRRYLQNTKWVKNSTSAEEMKKFQGTLSSSKSMPASRTSIT
jgi:hypothetical protein